MKEKAVRINQLIYILLLLQLFIVGCESKEEGHWKKVVYECIPLVKACNKLASEPKITGKILVWDMQKDRFSSLQKGLNFPEISDQSVTLVFILKKYKESVGVYGTTKLIGYRETLEYCLIYWPERVPGGKFTIADDPPQKRTERTASTSGDAEAKLKVKLEELMKK